MGRSVEEESTLGSETFMPHTQSFLGGIKRVINFFTMSEEELRQAGIDVDNTHESESDGQENPPTEPKNNGRVH